MDNSFSASPVPAELTAKYSPPLFTAMLESKALQPGPCPVVIGSTSMVYVVMLLGEFFMNLAHSSAKFPCDPFGDKPVISTGRVMLAAA